ncbi:carboxypeptidase-like regulatory domain-containing protein [Litorivita pollutaquae]|nr:carboxypeptidase-like regulatory domain-containing protein [Litorivita pollutaquae]
MTAIPIKTRRAIGLASMRLCLCAFGLVAGLAMPAAAHKVIASVYASGATIEGEIGFSSGDMARGAEVIITDDEGAVLGRAITDEEGFFTFRPVAAVGHVFRADLGAGHVAQVRLEADELPRGLTDTSAEAVRYDGAQAQAQAAGAGLAWSGGGSAPGDVVGGGVGAVMPVEAQEALAQMLQDELRPLRREVMALKETRRVQDVLGGLGYIAGLFGLGFYIAARRKLDGGP